MSTRHNQATINHFHKYRYLTPDDLASISDMSKATAWRVLNELRSRGFLVKDGRRYSLKREPLYYSPAFDNPSTQIIEVTDYDTIGDSK